MYRAVCLVAILVASLGMAPAVFAQGFGVYEQGACAMARAGTGVASPCEDGSAVFYNPAAIALAKRQEIGVNGTFIMPRGDFTNDKTGAVSPLNRRTYPVPDIYWVRPLNKKVAVGFGLFAPYGLTTDWPNTSEGRFLGYKSLVQGIYLQPTVAYNVSDMLAIGGGVDITYLNVELRQHADLSAVAVAPGLTFAQLGVPAGTDFADVQLKGNAWHAGYHLGMVVTMSDKVSFGVRYLGGQKVAVNNGKVSYTQIPTGLRLPVPLSPLLPAGTPIDAIMAPQFAAGGPLSNQGATTSLPLPAQLVLGTAFQVSPKAKLLIDYQFTRWSKFDALVIDQEIGSTLTTVESYGDTHGIRFGVEYAVNPATTIRGGFLAHTAAAPDQTVTPNLPEGPRREVTVGLGRQLGGRVRIDFAYQYLHQADRAGRTTTGGLAVPTAAVNNGVYHFKGHLFGITLGF